MSFEKACSAYRQLPKFHVEKPSQPEPRFQRKKRGVSDLSQETLSKHLNIGVSLVNDKAKKASKSLMGCASKTSVYEPALWELKSDGR